MAPVITSLSPTQGRTPQLMTITGTGLGAPSASTSAPAATPWCPSPAPRSP
ncbi:IPT/TIG domain-containing protein [Streptomyces zingiberis]|uniref:IPT/TIG domain-containing protein n=1 Tax=Streptomyces zingiberis TaxID=2053010 RepID=UPI0035D43E56